MQESLLSFIISTYLIVVVTTFLLLVIGGYTSSLLKISIPVSHRYFLYTLLGLVVLVICFSIFYTNIKGTTNVVFLVVLIFWFLVYNKNRRIKMFVEVEKFKIKAADCLNVLFVSSFSFLINIFIRFKFDSWPFFKIGKDEIFYCLVTKHIENKHIESTSIDWSNYGENISIRPYHYFEQWLNMINYKLFSFSLVESMYFIVLPVFIVITVFGLHSILERFNIANRFKILLAFIFCFFGFLSIEMDGAAIFSVYSLISTSLKYLPLFWIGFILLYVAETQKWNLFFCVLLLYPFFNYAFYPMVLVFFMIYIALFGYVFKEKRKAYVFISYIICIVGIPMLYKYNLAPNFKGQYDQKLSEVYNYYMDGQFFEKLKMIFGMGFFYLKNIVLKNIGVILLILFFLILNFNKSVLLNKKAIILFSFLIVFSSWCISSILNFLLDANQIFYLTFQIVLGLVFIVVASNFISALKNNIKRMLLFSFLICCSILNIAFRSDSSNFEIFRNYDKEYRGQIQRVVHLNPEMKSHCVGVRFMNKNYYKSIYEIQSTDQYEGFPFIFLTDNLHLYTLNVDVVRKEGNDPFGIYKFAYDRYSNIEYFAYWMDKKGLHSSDSLELLKGQLEFINEMGVDFIIVQKGAIVPGEIMNLTSNQITSSKNGETLYFLKK